jgi:histidinol phosphatase-like enzyme
MAENDNRFALLDRDGVINEDHPGSILSESHFVLLPRAPAAIAVLNHKGYRVPVVTNQACVGRGALPLPEL